MLASFGSIFIVFAIIFGLLATLCPFFFRSIYKDFLYKLILCSANIFTIFSFLTLIVLFISKDFRVIAVLANISSLMELKYRIAASWSSHETSLLFWCFIIAVINLIFFFQTSFREKIINSISVAILICFLLCIFFAANPFRSIDSFPLEGLGMNPSLQDFGIMVHPPLLYLSYAIFQIIYAANIASLFTKNIPAIISHWSRAGLAILLGAIGLGGWWAYRELGWGGYWFFDPVENISLIIFLFAISYHHSLLQKNLRFTKIIFGVLPFLCALLGTFFVRSGLLISVHSFAETPSSGILLFFSGALALTSYFIIFAKLSNDFVFSEYSTKTYFIQAGNSLWSIAGVIIIFSIIFPVIISVFFGDIIEIKESFFIKIIIPIMLLSAALAGLVYFNKNINKMLIIIICNLAIFIVALFLLKANILQSFAYFVGSLLVSSSLIRALEKKKSCSLTIPSISMLLGHIAAGLLIITICFNKQYGFSKTIIVSEKETVKIENNYSISLDDIEYGNGKNYIKQIASLRVLEKDNEIAKIKPELRFYPIEKSLSSEVDIYKTLTEDWYCVLNNILDGRASLQIFYHPAISWIWFSIFLAIISILLRIVI